MTTPGAVATIHPCAKAEASRITITQALLPSGACSGSRVCSRLAELLVAGLWFATHTPAATGAGRSGATTSRTPAIGTRKIPPLVAGEPLGVASASLAQDSLDLVWRVRLAQPFTPDALARGHRTLCLLIEPDLPVAVFAAIPTRADRRRD